MPRPRKEPHEKRTQRHNVRFTAAELAHVQAQAEAAGIDVAEYLRRRALGYQVPAGGGRGGADPAILSELNRIGVNVNQLARATHVGRDFVRYWKAIGADLSRVLERMAGQQEV